LRPAGEIRQALIAALRDAGEPVTTKAAAARACTGVEATRRTLGNMVRDGKAAVVDTCRLPGVRRPVPRYGLVMAEPVQPQQRNPLPAFWPAHA